MSKKLTFWLALGILVLAGVAIFRFADTEATLFESARNGTGLILPIVLVAAAIDSINPCAFSVLLLTIAFLFSLGKNRDKVVKTGASYIFGIFITYILIGLGVLQILQLFDIPHSMAKIGAIVIIIFGAINIINDIFPSFPVKLKIPQSAHTKIAALMEKGSVPAAFFLGCVVGMYEFPCTGGPYLFVLGLLHDQATYLSGAWYLFVYNAVFVLPLAIILFVASDETLLEKVRTFRKEKLGEVRFIEGIIMILLGAIIFVL